MSFAINVAGKDNILNSGPETKGGGPETESHGTLRNFAMRL